MSIVLQGSTSGSITLQEPAVAGSTVLSLPATSGTLITTGSSGQSIPKAALPTGSVLQVVSATYSTQVGPVTSILLDALVGVILTDNPETSAKVELEDEDVSVLVALTTCNTEPTGKAALEIF